MSLHECAACGFLSTVGAAFVTVDGVLLDRTCADRYRNGEHRTVEWVRAAKARDATQTTGQGGE